jgi:hypothetical protein
MMTPQRASLLRLADRLGDGRKEPRLGFLPLRRGFACFQVGGRANRLWQTLSLSAPNGATKERAKS